MEIYIVKETGPEGVSVREFSNLPDAIRWVQLKWDIATNYGKLCINDIKESWVSQTGAAAYTKQGDWAWEIFSN